jgi:hypothetical protein
MNADIDRGYAIVHCGGVADSYADLNGPSTDGSTTQETLDQTVTLSSATPHCSDTSVTTTGGTGCDVQAAAHDAGRLLRARRTRWRPNSWWVSRPSFRIDSSVASASLIWSGVALVGTVGTACCPWPWSLASAAALAAEDVQRDVRLVANHPAVMTGPGLGTGLGQLEPWRTLGREPFLVETSRAGVFAVGDVRSGSTKMVAPATGDGGMATRFAAQHLAFRRGRGVTVTGAAPGRSVVIGKAHELVALACRYGYGPEELNQIIRQAGS